jgi:hypothetical protein
VGAIDAVIARQQLLEHTTMSEQSLSNLSKRYLFFIFLLNSNNYTIYPWDMDNKYIFCLIYNNGKSYITW